MVLMVGVFEHQGYENMREEKRLILLKRLLQQELASEQPSLVYVEDLKLSIKWVEVSGCDDYQMVENV